MHVGVDNLNVVRHVSRIIDGSLVHDGDLLLRIQQLVFCKVLLTLLFLRLRVMRMKAW